MVDLREKIASGLFEAKEGTDPELTWDGWKEWVKAHRSLQFTVDEIYRTADIIIGKINA